MNPTGISKPLAVAAIIGLTVAPTPAEEPPRDHALVLFPEENKDSRIALLAETHRITGSGQEVNQQHEDAHDDSLRSAWHS